MKRPILLVDGNSLANRAFYALPALSNSQGTPTGAVYGFLTMMFKLIEEKNPSHLLVAFDHPSPTFRHREYPDYKKTRKPAPDEFKAQMPILRDVLDSLGVRWVEVPGYEADDIIGTMSRIWASRETPVIILSGDRDCLQLVEEGHVSVILPVRGITQTREFDVDGVRQEMGVLPAQIPDYKGLAGDVSDNIPGVKGIGEKTACSLLQQFGSLEELYREIDLVKPERIKKLLIEGKEQAFLSRDLATVFRQVPLELSDEELVWQGPDISRARPILSKLEFRSLLDRLGSGDERRKMHGGELEWPLIDSPERGNQGQKLDRPADRPESCRPSQVKYLDSRSDLLDVLKRVKASGRVAVYAGRPEVTRDFRLPGVVAVHVDGQTCILRPGSRDGSQRQPAREELFWEFAQAVLGDPSIEKVGFDIKWLYTLAFSRGIECRGRVFDILVAAYLLDPTRTAYRLEDLVRKYLGTEISAEISRSDDSALERHLEEGVRCLFDVQQKIADDMASKGVLDLARDVEFPLIEVLAAMEATGVRVDLELARSIRKSFGDALALLEESIYRMAGEKFNLSSPRQLSYILFEKLKLNPVKKTKTGYSTDAEVLEALSLDHELPAKILEYRQYAKLKSTYLDSLDEAINPVTGRIHTTFHQTVTATGRLSSSEPNLQNVPVRGELGRSIRKIFIPEDGHLFMASDYSQIELRLMAHMSGDPTMIDAFMRGEDIHARTASEIFGVPLEKVDEELRSKAKAVNFGIIYGISDYGLARNAGVSRIDARKFIEAYFARYPKVKEYMDHMVEKARRDGYVTTIFGRRRPIPDIDSRIRQKRGFAERTAINTPIQGSAADIIKLAMVRIYKRMKEGKMKSKLILQVHDELIFEIPPEEEEAMRNLVREEMEGVVQLRVPLKVEIDVGKSWYDV